jgi:competence protein ComEC
MVDCGGETEEAAADQVVQTLLSQGITQLDGVIVTHYDDDHAGGMKYVLSRIQVESLYLPDTPDAGNNRSDLEELGGDRISWIPENSTMKIRDSGLTLYTTAAVKSDNESSMCVLFQADKCDILITGDRGSSGEKALLACTDIPDLEVLIVGHHGAKGTASLELLTQTHPEVALISVGSDNPYGHPAEDVLERLELFDCEILTTAQNGMLTIRG